MDLTEPKDNGKEGGKREYQPQSSFFCWFTDDCDAVGDVIGESIKDELWPNPLQFYLNPDIDSDEVEGKLWLPLITSFVAFPNAFCFPLDDLLDEEEDEDEEEEDDEDGQDLAYDEAGGEDAPKSS